MRSSNNSSRVMSPALWGVTIILILLLIALSYILFLLSRENASNPLTDNPAIAGEANTQAVATNPTDIPPAPTNTLVPTLVPTEVPTDVPTETPEPTPTSEPTPTEIVESIESIDVEGSAEAISETVALTDTVGITETVDITDTVTIDETTSEGVTDTVDIDATAGITDTTLITDTAELAGAADPVLVCEAGPLESDDGCVYDVSIGLAVQNGSIQDWYLSNTGTCGVPATHKLIEITPGLVTVEGSTEYVIGGEYFPVGHTVAPDVDITVNEPPFIFLNFIIPEEPGVYESCWRLSDENNNPYGEPLITTIVVEEPAETEEGTGEEGTDGG